MDVQDVLIASVGRAIKILIMLQASVTFNPRIHGHVPPNLRPERPSGKRLHERFEGRGV